MAMALAPEVYWALQMRGFRDYIYDPADNDGLDDTKFAAAFRGQEIPTGRNKAEETAYQRGRSFAKKVVEVYGWGELPNLEGHLAALAGGAAAPAVASPVMPSSGFGASGSGSVLTAGFRAVATGVESYAENVVNSAESKALAEALGLSED